MRKQYYSEEELIEKHQKGEINWLGYVTGHSEEWDEEFKTFLKERGLEATDESAWEFLQYKDRQMGIEHEEGNI